MVDLSSAPWTMHGSFAGSGLVAYGLKGMFAPVWANDISEQKAAVCEAKETIERVFADAKEKHARCYTYHRGLTAVTRWVRLKFAAMNLKRLAGAGPAYRRSRALSSPNHVHDVPAPVHVHDTSIRQMEHTEPVRAGLEMAALPALQDELIRRQRLRQHGIVRELLYHRALICLHPVILLFPHRLHPLARPDSSLLFSSRCVKSGYESYAKKQLRCPDRRIRPVRWTISSRVFGLVHR